MHRVCEIPPFPRGLQMAAALAVLSALFPGSPSAAPGGPSPEQLQYLCSDIKTPLFSENSSKGGVRSMGPSRPRLNTRGFLLPKPAGRSRVFIVGESVAGLLGDISGLLGPDADVELINCGMGAYDSQRILAAFEEVSSYEPDLVVVMSGNNELGRETCPGLQADFERAKRAVKLKLQSLFSDARDAERQARLATHRARLLRMAAIAREKGFPVVFCTLPANERDFSPYGAPAQAAAGDGHEALRRSVLASPKDAFAHYRLARALDADGKSAEAKEHYGLAIEWDPLPDRCSPSRNEMIREAAASGGACLADLEKDFSGIAPDGIVGGGLIADGVHWHRGLNGFVGARLWRHIAACPAAAGLVPSAAGPGPGKRLAGAEERALASLKTPIYAEETARYAAYYAAAYVRSGVPGVRERAISLLDRADRLPGELLVKALGAKKNFLAGMPSNLWVGDMHGSAEDWWPPLLEAAAEARRRRGAPVPALFAAAAPPSAPEAEQELPGPMSSEYKRRSVSYSDSAVTKYLAGDLEGARADLEAAVETDGDNIPALVSLCALHMRQARYGKALESCDLAVNAARFPSEGDIVNGRALPDALLLRSEVYRRSGEPGKAAGDLRAALSAGGGDWPDRPLALEKLKEFSASP